jgi:hypothetical protein
MENVRTNNYCRSPLFPLQTLLTYNLNCLFCLVLWLSNTVLDFTHCYSQRLLFLFCLFSQSSKLCLFFVIFVVLSYLFFCFPPHTLVKKEQTSTSWPVAIFTSWCLITQALNWDHWSFTSSYNVHNNPRICLLCVYTSHLSIIYLLVKSPIEFQKRRRAHR